jgi:hypothetical protein
MLRKHRPHHLLAYIRVAGVSALEAVGELFVIEAEEVEHRGVEIRDGESVFDGGVAELVCGAIHLAAFDAGMGPTHG